MLRSTIRRLRRTLSFRSRKKKTKETTAGGNGGSNQNWENDASKIKNGGCSFQAKYLGSVEVSESRGTQVCSQAAHQMKMSAAGKKKQKVTLWVTEDTLKVTDDDTKVLVIDQVIEKVSFCTPDPHDGKLFSYICRDGTSKRWICYCFKGVKDSGERISHAVGCAFAACLAKKQELNLQNQHNLQRGASARKTLEARPNGIKLPQQSVDTLKKLNQQAYDARVEKAKENQSIYQTTAITTTATHSSDLEEISKGESEVNNVKSSLSARPRPTAAAASETTFARHSSLPYRTNKTAAASSGVGTYQTLDDDEHEDQHTTEDDNGSQVITTTQNEVSSNFSNSPAFCIQTNTTELNGHHQPLEINVDSTTSKTTNTFNPFQDNFLS